MNAPRRTIVSIPSSSPRWWASSAGWSSLRSRSASARSVTHFVVGHSLGHGDLDIARWFAERRTDTWNSLSKIGSYFGETVTVFVVIAIALVVLAFKRAWPQFGLLAIAMAAEGGVYVTAHVRHQPQPSRGAAARGPDPRRQLPLGPHRRRDGALRLAVHHRLVAHPVPRVARAVPRPRDRRTADRRHVTRLPRHAQRDRRDLRTAHRRRVHHGRLRRRPRRAGRGAHQRRLETDPTATAPSMRFVQEVAR